MNALRCRLAEGRFPHALLISGERGIGKRNFARLIAAALLCSAEQPEERPCGVCRDCRMAMDEEHPDLIVIRKGTADGKKERASIPVDDIRGMVRLCGEHPAVGSVRVVLIENADALTPQAQNALLKTLEEPPTDTHFILVAERMSAILPTVISRCRRLQMHVWPEEEALRVLRERGVAEERARNAVRDAGGSVGKALELAGDESYWQRREEIIRAFFGTMSRSDLLGFSTAWKDRKAEAEDLFSLLETETERMLQVRLGRERAADTLQSFPERWQRFAARADYGRFAFLLDQIAKSRRLTAANVNFQAVTEQLMMAFIGEGNQWQQ